MYFKHEGFRYAEVDYYLKEFDHMPRPILATVHLSALKHNLLTVRRHLIADANRGESSFLPPSLTAPLIAHSTAHSTAPLIWAVIKANAYGHGIENAVIGFDQADGLAMLDFEEAARCRAAGWRKPLLMLEGCFQAGDLHVIDTLSLTPVVHRFDQIEWLAQHAFKKPVDVYLKVNTGMQRLGFATTDYALAFKQMQALQVSGQVGHITHMTHFACADEPDGVSLQMQLFDGVTSHLPGGESVCNSAASLRHAAVARRVRPVPTKIHNWVRPGICLYGSSPFADLTAASFELEPTLTLSAEIIGVQQVKQGLGIGYGHRFIAPHDMRVGIVSCGYADGYPRHAPDFTPVSVQGHLTHLVGRVSMDMLAVDLTRLPQAQVGAPVVLWGQDGPSVDTVAQHAGTIGYELLCAVAPRVKRQVNYV
jgi:alanine racemase